MKNNLSRDKLASSMALHEASVGMMEQAIESAKVGGNPTVVAGCAVASSIFALAAQFAIIRECGEDERSS